ncbi:MAG: hypothetical protein BA874_11800 [Desulfuromonadales bacterium C00003068]|jgi:glucose/arabinose dehydrogenase|nr:MAG: hypothetical protein BA874_11800 [Desulfuromonadales bacterium C00003068]
MKIIIRFALLTLLLSTGVFITMAIPFLSFSNSLLWFLSTFMIGAGLALVAKHCGRGALLLAIPISVLSANALVVHIWPPLVRNSVLRAFNEVAKRDDGYRQLRKQVLPITLQSLEVPAPLQQGWNHGERALEVAHGVSVSLFATGLNQPYALAVNERGVLFVSLPKVGQVVALVDKDGDGITEETHVIASGFDRPSGLAFKKGVLYVATASRVFALHDNDGDFEVERQQVIYDQLPAAKHHWAHALVVGADQQLYLSVGAEVGDEHWQRASVLRLSDNGSVTLHATGLYDCQGLAVHPKSGSIWATDDGPELLGFYVHPDELNVLVVDGDYGWPFCYGDRLPDADLGSPEICRSTQSSILQLPANASPRGLAFGDQIKGSSPYQSMLYMVLQGANYGKRQQGFRLMGVPLSAEGRILGWGVDLVSGWSVEGKPWGEPTDCVVGADGALYVTDQRAGCVYQVSFE